MDVAAIPDRAVLPVGVEPTLVIYTFTDASYELVNALPYSHDIGDNLHSAGVFGASATVPHTCLRDYHGFTHAKIRFLVPVPSGDGSKRGQPCFTMHYLVPQPIAIVLVGNLSPPFPIIGR